MEMDGAMEDADAREGGGRAEKTGLVSGLGWATFFLEAHVWAPAKAYFLLGQEGVQPSQPSPDQG
jgi:hypothetical protein